MYEDLFKSFLYTENNVSELYLKLKFLGFEKSFHIGTRVIFHWKEAYTVYFGRNDMEKKVKDLKKGMDKISCEYVDKFMELVSYWDCYRKNIWTKYDLILQKKKEEYEKIFVQPFPKHVYVDPFFISNIYGLVDLPNEVFDNINGKIIVDGGGLTGDTAIMFHKYFPDSEIHIFEPMTDYINIMNDFLQINNMDNKLFPIKKGLGEKEEVKQICYGAVEMSEIVTLDSVYKNSDKKVGVIKLDTEGYETLILNGGLELIKRDKPVLTIAIYHTPQDFFDLKQKLENLNVGYKFMIRRSQAVLPQADLVLIAY